MFTVGDIKKHFTDSDFMVITTGSEEPANLDELLVKRFFVKKFSKERPVVYIFPAC